MYGYHRINNEWVVMQKGFLNGKFIKLIDTLKNEG